MIAIDVAKKQNAVLILLPDGVRKKLTMAIDLQCFNDLAYYMKMEYRA